MQQDETPWGSWGYWWRMLVVGGIAATTGAVGLYFSRLALTQSLLPGWSRVVIGGAAIEVLLMSLLALVYLYGRWPRCQRCAVSTSIDGSHRWFESDVVHAPRTAADQAG